MMILWDGVNPAFTNFDEIISAAEKCCNILGYRHVEYEPLYDIDGKPQRKLKKHRAITIDDLTHTLKHLLKECRKDIGKENTSIISTGRLLVSRYGKFHTIYLEIGHIQSE